MADPIRHDAFAGLAAADRVIPGPEPVTLAVLPFRGKLILRGGQAVRALVAEVLGTELPPLLRSAVAGEVDILGLGPDEWLLLAPPDRAEALAMELRAALAGHHHAVVVISDRMTGLVVGGARARDVLSAGCAIDLHPSAFPPGSTTRTLLGKATIVLRRPDDAETYEIWVNGSFAPYVWLFLENAAREFGVVIPA